MKIIVEHDLIPGEWTSVGPDVADVGDEVLRTGSLSSEDEDGTRTMYMFGWHDGEGPTLWRSKGGADAELSDDRGRPRRVLFSTGLEVVEKLTPEKPTELRLRQRGVWINLRLRLVEP